MLRVGGHSRSVGECEVVWSLWGSAFEDLLLAEDSVVSLHHLITGDLDSTLNDLVTMNLSHVLLNYFWTLSPALSCCRPSSCLRSRVEDSPVLLGGQSSPADASVSLEAFGLGHSREVVGVCGRVDKGDLLVCHALRDTSSGWSFMDWNCDSVVGAHRLACLSFIKVLGSLHRHLFLLCIHRLDLLIRVLDV